jgi:hypothetical protein
MMRRRKFSIRSGKIKVMLLSSDQLILEGWEGILAHATNIILYKHHFKSSLKGVANLSFVPHVVLLEGSWLKVVDNKRWLSTMKSKHRLKVIVIYGNKNELRHHRNIVDESIEVGFRRQELLNLIKGVVLDDKTLCMYYADKLKRMPASPQYFSQHTELVANILQLVFGQDLTNPQIKTSRLAGNKAANLVFENNSQHPFWLELRKKHGMDYVVFSTRNDPDLFLDQFDKLGKFLSGPFGNMGFLINRRSNEKHPTDLQTSKYQNEGRAILILFDPFIRSLLAFKAAGAEPVELIQDAYQGLFLAIGDSKR